MGSFIDELLMVRIYTYNLQVYICKSSILHFIISAQTYIRVRTFTRIRKSIVETTVVRGLQIGICLTRGPYNGKR